MPAVTLTEENNGQAIKVRQGDMIELRLSENATTGFRWQVVRTDGLVEEPAPAQDQRPPVQEQQSAVGSGGTRVFRFGARVPGHGRLELKLWREFEGEASVLRRFISEIAIAE